MNILNIILMNFMQNGPPIFLKAGLRALLPPMKMKMNVKERYSRDKDGEAIERIRDRDRETAKRDRDCNVAESTDMYCK